MSKRQPDDGFAPMEESPPPGDYSPEPLGPGRRGSGRKQRSGNNRRGCMIGFLVAGALVLAAMVTCNVLLQRGLIDDPDEIVALADEIFTFKLPAGYHPEGGVNLPGVGTVVAFVRGPEGDERSLIALGDLHVEMSEEEAISQLGQASGQGTQGVQIESAPCEVAGRRAVCIDALADGEEGTRARWRAALLPDEGRTRLAAVVMAEERFDLEEANAFIGSLELP